MTLLRECRPNRSRFLVSEKPGLTAAKRVLSVISNPERRPAEAGGMYRSVRDEPLHGEATVGVTGLPKAGPNAAGAAERSPMWLLVIVLLNIVPGLERIMVLNTFTTSEECQIERNRIGFEMAKAYPYERDFVIACRLNPKHSS